jgi:putative oxidoreductase
MAVAGVAAHRPNGFFVFREGYEYVLFVAVAAVALAVLGPGQWSLDSALHTLPAGAAGLAIAAGAGLGGCALLLAASWRPHSSPVAETVLDEPLTAQDSRR